MIKEMKDEAKKAVIELLEVANLKEKDLFVIGCSSSEVGGHQIGSFSSTEIADALFEVLYKELKEKNIYLAVQCCEHLNRALILLHFYLKNALKHPALNHASQTADYLKS